MNTQSPRQYIKMAWKNTHEERVKALVAIDEAAMDIGFKTPPIPPYKSHIPEKWRKTGLYAFFSQVFP